MAREDLDFCYEFPWVFRRFLGLSTSTSWGLGGSGETLGRSREVKGAVGRSGKGPKVLNARAS